VRTAKQKLLQRVRTRSEQFELKRSENRKRNVVEEQEQEERKRKEEEGSSLFRSPSERPNL
jgi:hypothetical protein